MFLQKYKKLAVYTHSKVISYTIFYFFSKFDRKWGGQRFFCIFAKNYFMRTCIVTFLLIIFCAVSMAQTSVRYDVEPAIEKIQEDFISRWEQIGEVDGYRIQILAVTGTNSRSQAEGAKTTFEAQFPEIPAYMTYMEPYFRIRVGNFISRLEAFKTLTNIQWQYPNAYIIPDKIEYSDK